FGIQYRPSSHDGAKQGYELPSGPAFYDEDEFEQEMSAEFRVAAGVSGSGRQVPAASSSGVESERTDEKSLVRPQQEEGVINEKPTTSEDVVVNHPDPDNVMQLDNAEALRQLTDSYRKGGSSTTTQVRDALCDVFVPRDQQPFTFCGQSLEGESTNDNRGRVLMHVSGSAQRCPAIEEGNEGEEDGEGEDGGEGEGREETLQHVENPEQLQSPRQSEGQEEGGGREEESRHLRAAKEWEQIDQLRTAENSMPMEKGVGGALQPVSINEGDRVVCAADVLRHFRSQDLDEHKASIVPFQPRQSRLGLFCRAPTLKFPEAEQLRNEVFLIAKIPYTPKDIMHRRLIQTIYRRMTKEKRACPDVGPHWDTIGFQGTDPCTDLNRSMGVFSLLQVLYLLETQPAFAATIFRCSTADVTGWPFLCVSIGFTKGAVDVLRQGACYAESNRRKSVMEVVHEVHQAQFHAFLALCREEPATHHALHLAKVRTSTENDSPSLVKAYRTYLSDEKARSAMGVVGKTG
ncbi:unnamed protein product, partial [Laminaria digitata]